MPIPAPTYPECRKSEQVAFLENGKIRIVGKPEFHGNPQHPESGSLVKWGYGHDLLQLIVINTSFNTEFG